jgi:hypothetical protein
MWSDPGTLGMGHAYFIQALKRAIEPVRSATGLGGYSLPRYDPPRVAQSGEPGRDR